MCSVDETSEREMKGSEDITHARVIDSRLIYLEKISFFVRDNHNFLKVFEIHLPWWYFETLYNEIPSYHRPKLFFTSEFLFVGERKKKKKKNIENVQKFSLFSPWKISSAISRKIRSMRPRITVRTICSLLFRERIQPEIASRVSILPKFLSLFKNLDSSTTQLRVDASVSREPSPTLVFVRSTSRLHDGSKETRLRVPKIKRNGGVLPDSSKFEQIFLTISNDLDKLESIALKPRDIYRRRFFKRAGFACFQEINQRHPGQQETRPTINYIISIDPLPSPPIYRLLSQKHF